MDFLPRWPLVVSPTLVLGLLLQAGAVAGHLAGRTRWLPSITGFMGVGLLVGPGGVGLLDAEHLAAAHAFVDVALALILYRLGLSLDLADLGARPLRLLVSCCESLATFAAVYLVARWAGVEQAPALLVAAICISSSPAVLLHVAHELRASGPATEQSKALVALNNALSFFAFSLAVPLAHHVQGAEVAMIVLRSAYGFFGSLLLGIVLGVALHHLARFLHAAMQYRMALVFGAVLVALELAAELRLSPLFAPLAMGITVRSLGGAKGLAGLNFGPMFELFFIILFVLAGASMHLTELWSNAPILLALVAARALAKLVTVVSISRLGGHSACFGLASGMLVLPMAGLAIGLVHTTSALHPGLSAGVATLVFGAVAVFETVGPPLAAWAFRIAGEAGARSDAGDATDPVPNPDHASSAASEPPPRSP